MWPQSLPSEHHPISLVKGFWTFPSLRKISLARVRAAETGSPNNKLLQVIGNDNAETNIGPQKYSIL